MVQMVPAHFEYGEFIFHCHLESIESTDRTIVDSGADISIVGAGWYVISYSQLTINLVGYDPNSTRCNRLPVVSAVTTVMIPR